MYTEDDNFEKRPFPWRDFLLKLAIVIVFVFLLVWIISKFVSPKEKVEDTTTTNQVFSENLERMKEAAIDYYTQDTLPQTQDESQTMTLREMINKNLLIPFVDENGKACSVDDSYVTVTNEGEEYLLKVNLKCSEQEDYLLTHIGNYSYCENGGICEKNDDLATNETTEGQIDSSSIANTSVGDNRSSNASSGENSQSNTSASDNQTSVNVAPQEVTEQPASPPAPTLYEYAKVEAPTFTNWQWSAWQMNDKGLQESRCNNQDTSCLQQVQLLTRKEVIGNKAAYVSYYSIGTRQLLSQGGTTIKWSTYNDQSLLSAGYTYTGNEKQG